METPKLVSVDDSDHLLRRIPQNGISIDESTGQPRINRFAIQNGTDDDGNRTNDMSVSLEKLESLIDIKVRWEGNSIGQIVASDCHAEKQETLHVPEKGFHAHGHVSGHKSGGVRKRLSKKMILVHHEI